jgi:hypothetical protein
MNWLIFYHYLFYIYNLLSIYTIPRDIPPPPYSVLRSIDKMLIYSFVSVESLDCGVFRDISYTNGKFSFHSSFNILTGLVVATFHV